MSDGDDAMRPFRFAQDLYVSVMRRI